MAQPSGALVPRVCGNHVDRPNVLLHLAGWAVRQAPEEGYRRWHNSIGVDGPQRRILCCRKTERPKGWSRASSLVPMGSGDDMAERSGAAVSRLLFQQRT